MTKKYAKCQRTDKEILLSDGFYIGAPSTGEWCFVCKDAPENPGDYPIAVSDLTKSPESLVDWMAHLNEKTWFNPKKFFEFFEDFRKKNQLYNSL